MTYTRTNLVPNPSATVNTTGWAATTGTLTRDTTVSRSGGASFKITAGTGMDTPSGTSGIPVTPGVTYRFSFWAQGNNTTDTATFQCSWYDSGGALISSASPASTTMNTTAWVLVAPANPSTQYTAPSNAAYLRLSPRISATSTVWFDDIMVSPVEPGVEWPVYFDGDTADTAEETFSWSGTANQSASTATYTGRVNLLPNPSWELDTSGWTGTSRTVSAGAAPVISGTSYASVSSSTISAKQYAIAGTAYTASGWFTRGSAARTVTIGIRFYNGAGTELDPPTLTQTSLVTQDVPERRSMTRTAPAGTVSMSVVVSANNVTNGDAFLLEPSATLGDYFDGDSTAATGYYAYWTGTPHNSTARLSTVAPPVRTNLFTHPSAEGSSITWTAAVSDPTMTRTTSAAIYGSESYQMTVVTGGANQEVVTPTGTSAFPVLPGNSYALSAYFGRSGTTAVRSGTVRINWYTSAGTFISNSASSALTEGSGTALIWIRNSIIATAPATAAYASVQLRWTVSPLAGEVHYVEGILFEQTPYLYDYFDGSSTKSGYTYTWLGTAHASQSTQAAGVATVTVTFKRYESGAWVTRTAKPKAWNGTEWVIRRPKRWNGASWVDLE